MAVGPLEPFLGTDVVVAKPYFPSGSFVICAVVRFLDETVSNIMRHDALEKVLNAIVYDEGDQQLKGEHTICREFRLTLAN